MINTWTDGRARIVSENRPGKGFWPEIDLRRVQSRYWYQPYRRGSEEWRQAANDALAATAAERPALPHWTE